MEEKLKCTNSSTAYSPTLPASHTLTHTYPENDNVEINHLECVLNMFFVFWLFLNRLVGKLLPLKKPPMLLFQRLTWFGDTCLQNDTSQKAVLIISKVQMILVSEIVLLYVYVFFSFLNRERQMNGERQSSNTKQISHLACLSLILHFWTSVTLTKNSVWTLAQSVSNKWTQPKLKERKSLKNFLSFPFLFLLF